MTAPRVLHPAPMPANVTPLPRVLQPRRALPSDAVRPTRAEVNLAHLRSNLRVLQRAAGGAEVWGVLKADGYGHGSKATARTLERAGIRGICVALLEEAVELREAGIQVPILVMGGHHGWSLGEFAQHQLTPVAHELRQLVELANEVRYRETPPLPVHVKFDTGMSRLGFPMSQAAAVADLLAATPELKLDGVMTHFANADDPADGMTEVQLARFAEVNAVFAARGLHGFRRHAANTAALLARPEAQLDIVRPGIGLFGIAPAPGLGEGLKPVMRIRTAIVALRDLPPGATVGYGATWVAQRPTRVATIPMGYADGLHRGLSNRGHVLVRGRRAPIVGIVSMDLATIDVTDLPGVDLGDEAVVLGDQKGPLGADVIDASEVAQHLGTIPWEVLTSISRRVPRFYREP